MFTLFGKVIAKGWPVFLACWAVLGASVYMAVPPWDTVADDREFGFLPEEVPSRQGEAVFQAAFPQQGLGSNVVIVLHRDNQALTHADYGFIDKGLKPALASIVKEEGGFAAPGPRKSSKLAVNADEPIISKINTAFDPGTGPLLVSADHQAMLVVLDLTTEFMERRNWETLEKIENAIGKLRAKGRIPSELAVNLTGSAAVGRDVGLGQAQSAAATGRWTVILVIGLLLLIYRAPLLALVPLLTIFSAVQVSLGLLSLLGQAGVLTLFEGIQIYITIILYGAGVDYCLFLIARYREELDEGRDVAGAMTGAIGKVGASLTASAATVMFGIGMMAAADFGKFHYAGIAIFLSLIVGYAAVLTLAAPLMCLMGRWAFWPKMPVAKISAAAPAEPPKTGVSFVWERLAQGLVRRPVTIWLTSVALMCPFVVIALRSANHVNYDLLQRLAGDQPGVLGIKALQKHFSPGVTGPVTILLQNPRIDFRAEETQALLKTLTERLQRRRELGLTDIRGLATPLGIAKPGLAKGPQQVAVPFLPAASAFGTGPSVFDPGWSSSLGGDFGLGADYQRQRILRQRALEHYVSSVGTAKGHVTQLQLLVDMNPLSREGTERLDLLEKDIRDALPADLEGDTKLFAIGPTASIRDLITVTGGDEVRVKALVAGCVFLILLVLLRRLVVAIYLIASVLFSYFTAQGVTYAVFWALEAESFPGLDWKVSILLFTVLVAIGADYNIFLMTRIDEESAGHADSRAAITRALVKTGGIITSCGLIMAGTFATLLAGSLVDLKQLGFALAFGVLLDTFVVRPVLAPAFLIWWRGSRPA